MGQAPDTQGPALAVSGDLREAEDEFVYDGTHEVVVDASDGSAAAPESGVRRVEFEIDGAVVDSVEQPCPLGNCQVQKTFSVDTKAMQYGGGHDFEVRAIDVAGNVRSDAWMVATEPVETVFTLSTPALLELVLAAAVTSQADIIDMTHWQPGVGGYVPGGQSPGRCDR